MRDLGALCGNLEESSRVRAEREGKSARVLRGVSCKASFQGENDKARFSSFEEGEVHLPSEGKESQKQQRKKIDRPLSLIHVPTLTARSS